MSIYVSLKKNEVILKVNITSSRLKKHFKVSLRETFLEHFSVMEDLVILVLSIESHIIIPEFCFMGITSYSCINVQ